MKQLISILFFLVAFVGNTFADNKDKLYTTDNKEYIGYISTQIPGKQIIFISDDQAIPFDVTELLMIKYEERNPKLLTGLNDVIKTREGKFYSGQIIEQTFGKTIKIKTTEGEETIEASEILEQQKTKMSKDYTLIQQAPYKTLVKTSNDEEYTGVIVFQFYGNDENPSYLEISSEDGISKRINISDINQMRRVPNNEYQEVEAFTVEDGKVYFNQTVVDPVTLSKLKKGRRVIYYLDDLTISNQAILDGGTGKLTIEMKEDTEYTRYKLMKIECMKIGRNNLYAYEEELEYKSIIDPYTSTIDSNKTMSKVFDVEKGTYLFYKPGSDIAFFLEIK